MNGLSHRPALSLSTLDTLLRRAPVNVFLFDDNLICRYAAPVGDEFRGRPRHELMGRHAAEILPPANNGLRAILERAAREALSWRDPEHHFTVQTDDGETRHCWAIEVEPVATRRVRGVLVSWSDMSDLIAERDHLRAAVDELRRREDEQRLALVHIVAELRSLLTPAVGYLQVISRRPQLLGGRSLTAVIAEHVLPRLDDVVRSVDRLREAPFHSTQD